MERVVKKAGAVLVEFDNARYLKELGNQYQDLQKMSNTMKIDQIFGTFLPKTRMLGSFYESVGSHYAKLARTPLLKPYAFKWVVKFIKV